MEKNRAKIRKIIITILVCTIFLIGNFANVFAAVVPEDQQEIPVNEQGIPLDGKYLELRATEVKDVEGQNKQVIMQLWSNKIDFQRI